MIEVRAMFSKFGGDTEYVDFIFEFESQLSEAIKKHEVETGNSCFGQCNAVGCIREGVKQVFLGKAF